MKNYYGVNISEQRQKLLKSEICKPFLDDIIANADAALEAEYTVDTYSKYTIYHRTGHRTDGEYNARRRNCTALAIAYWLTEDEKYLNALVDVIYVICSEFSWCLPAHSHIDEGNSIDLVIHMIDLCQSETAKTLTDVIILLGDKLPSYATERIEYEIRRRIFEAFKKYPYFHASEGQLNNWSTVCMGSCAVALLHLGTDEEISELLPRLIKGLDRYLQGLPTDGCCQEGAGYWNYGFGYYSCFAKILYEYSGGEINYLKEEKVKKLALFPQKVRLNENLTVSFADANPYFSFNAGLFSFLKRNYDGVLLPDLKHAVKTMNIHSLLWMDPEYKADAPSNETYYLDDSQWYINKKKTFSFAAKGGHNYEPHNHNDLGSFMIAVGDDIPLADLGAPEYIKYKEYDDRMVNLNFSSKGHSVPIINGQYQCLGKEYKSQVITASENVFSLDLQGAYESGLVNRYNRTFTVNDDSVLINDTFEYSEKTESITERFVTWTEPKITDGEIDLSTAKILFDKNLYSVNISVDYYNQNQNLPNAGELIKVYLIDFTAKKDNETKFNFKIEI